MKSLNSYSKKGHGFAWKLDILYIGWFSIFTILKYVKQAINGFGEFQIIGFQNIHTRCCAWNRNYVHERYNAQPLIYSFEDCVRRVCVTNIFDDECS